MNSLKVGDTFKLQPIISVPVDADGSYSLAITDFDRLTTSAGRNGVMNVETMDESGKEAPFSFSMGLEMNSAGRAVGLNSINGLPSARALTVPSTDNTSHASSEPTASGAAVATTSAAPKTCSSKVVQDYGARLAAVGERYTTGPVVANTDFQYVQGATSGTSVGLSSSGSFGTFKASGSTTVTATSEVDFTTKDVSTVDRTYFHWQKYYVNCSYEGGGPGGVYYETHYEARPTYAGGSSSVSVGLPSGQRYCVRQDSGSTFIRDSSTAITWSNGVNTGPAFGLDLSVTTGYTSKAKVSFKMKRNGHICGTNGFPGETPAQLISTG
ncbi:hypothetical protein ABLG96_11995 [Nakamurella sp. A5-74]|uniref:Uncharacterized protein n=1 Tax=Nakamurella sp. A5-74 TaxID=3158264 RepID=A0AAU8DJ60_9ACTN